MNVFTDKNLEVLEEVLRSQKSRDKIDPGIFVDEIKALICRLKAAELGAEQFAIENPDNAIVRNWFARMGRSYDDWPKAIK